MVLLSNHSFFEQDTLILNDSSNIVPKNSINKEDNCHFLPCIDITKGGKALLKMLF